MPARLLRAFPPARCNSFQTEGEEEEERKVAPLDRLRCERLNFIPSRDALTERSTIFFSLIPHSSNHELTQLIYISPQEEEEEESLLLQNSYYFFYHLLLESLIFEPLYGQCGM